MKIESRDDSNFMVAAWIGKIREAPGMTKAKWAPLQHTDIRKPGLWNGTGVCVCVCGWKEMVLELELDSKS